MRTHSNLAVLVLAGVTCALFVAAAIWPLPGAGQATDNQSSALGSVSGGCTLTKVKFATNDSSISTTSTSFVNIPSMTASFTVSGSVATCLKVEFSASVQASAAGHLMYVIAVLDSASLGLPADAYFASNNTGWNAHAFNFAFANVAPGGHSVKLQWRSNDGTAFYMIRRSLFVHYQ